MVIVESESQKTSIKRLANMTGLCSVGLNPSLCFRTSVRDSWQTIVRGHWEFMRT